MAVTKRSISSRSSGGLDINLLKAVISPFDGRRRIPSMRFDSLILSRIENGELGALIVMIIRFLRCALSRSIPQQLGGSGQVGGGLVFDQSSQCGFQLGNPG